MALPQGEKIVIDLSTEDVVRWSERLENLLHPNAYAQIVGHIRRLRRLIDSNSASATDGRSLENRYHKAITIGGGRGSGKTTFVLNLLEAIRKDRKEADKGVFEGLEVLTHLDPTTIESKESILVAIVALIDKRCASHWEKASESQELGELRKRFRKKLEILARGLKGLDGVGAQGPLGSQWDDPSHILQEGLEDARAARDLEMNFHALIDAALAFLGKKAFVLALDDIDTRFDRGWPVLEVLRKFLTTPRMIVLVTGDLRLYSMLVRRQQYQNLGRELLDYDRPRREFHADTERRRWRNDRLAAQVDTLEEQYIRKILPAEYRIELHSVADLVADGRTVAVKANDGDEAPTDILHLIDDFCRGAHGIEDPDAQGFFRKSLLEQPIRSLVQFLRVVLRHSESPGRFQAKNLRKFNLDYYLLAHSSFFHEEVSERGLLTTDFARLCGELIRWAERTGDWENFSRLNPETESSDRNLVAIGFSSAIQAFTRESPHAVFEYMLRVGLTRELMLIRKSVTPRQIIEALGIESAEKAVQVARRAMAAHTNFLDSFKPYRGTYFVPVYSYSSKRAAFLLWGESTADYENHASTVLAFTHIAKNADAALVDRSASALPVHEVPILGWWEKATALHRVEKDSVYGVFFNSLESINKRFDWGPAVGWISIILSSERREWSGAVSVYPLIGLLSECLRINNDLPKSSKQDAVHDALRRTAQFRTYPLGWPSAPGRQIDEAAVDPDEGESVGRPSRQRKTRSETGDGAAMWERHGAFTRAVAEKVAEWMDEYGATSAVANPRLMHRIFVRFYYTLTRIDEEIQSDQRYAGVLLHRQIVAFLNAVLVEEQIALKEEPGLSAAAQSQLALNNPAINDGVFRRNLEILGVETAAPADLREKAPLFALVWAFPLWGLYLAPTTSVYEGTRRIDFSALNLQRKFWATSGSVSWSTANPNEAILQRTTFIGRFSGEENERPHFESLWAPLNSVPVYRPGTTATKVPIKRRGRRKKVTPPAAASG